LCAAVGHIGWLSAVPKGRNKQRAELYENNELILKSPYVKHFAYMLRLSANIGYISGAGDAKAVLNYTEISAYVTLMDKKLKIWEVETLRKMSAAFLKELYDTEEYSIPNSIVPILEDKEHADYDKAVKFVVALEKAKMG